MVIGDMTLETISKHNAPLNTPNTHISGRESLIRQINRRFPLASISALVNRDWRGMDIIELWQNYKL